MPAPQPPVAFTYPRGFLWGTATAAHQVEGNNKNNTWYAWEQQPGRILNGHKSGMACDWWGGRWKEDLDRAAESGQNAHRFSIEWSRIQPEPGRWDENALDYYRQMLHGMHQRGLTPMVTLHHFSEPLWVADRGGWEDPQIVGLFAAYVRKAVEALRELATLWVTINEPNVYAYSGWVDGLFPPGKKDVNLAFTVMANLVSAHAAAYRIIHELQPQARVGLAVHYRSIAPSRPWLPLDGWAAQAQKTVFNDLFPRATVDGIVNYVFKKVRIPEAVRTQDFLGVNYYSRDRVAFSLTASGLGKRFYPKDADLSGTGFIANEPKGLFESLKWGLRYQTPIIVTENGVEDAEDRMRPRYIAEHIREMWRGVNFSWPIKGYFHWSLVDNFEWERGWTQRFGLWELDERTQARRKRPSADLYAAICRQNALSSEMVAQYAPEVLQKLFPG